MAIIEELKQAISVAEICGGTRRAVLPNILYDCVKPNARGGNTYIFFQTKVGERILGTADEMKTHVHTNLETPSRLPKGETFDIIGCFMAIAPLIYRDADGAGLAYLQYIMKGSVEIIFGTNSYRIIPVPLLLHSEIKITIGAGSGDSALTMNYYSMQPPMLLDKGYFTFSEVKRIEEDMTFNVKYELVETLPDNNNPFYVYFGFVGYHTKYIGA
ncbi:MAG: hypothetical protein QXO40_00260 [Candidatus Aenigmatarchaeota archaeon]